MLMQNSYSSKMAQVHRLVQNLPEIYIRHGLGQNKVLETKLCFIVNNFLLQFVSQKKVISLSVKG